MRFYFYLIIRLITLLHRFHIIAHDMLIDDIGELTDMKDKYISSITHFSHRHQRHFVGERL